MRSNLGLCCLFTLVLALCSFPEVQAQERDILELYRLAKVKDPAVSRAEARLEGGKADKEMAWAALMPKVSANGAVRQFLTKVLYYGPTAVDGEYTGYSYGVGAAFPVVSMPSYYQVRVADAGINSAEAGIQVVRQDLIVRLVDGYVRYLKGKADEKVFRDELSRVGKVLTQAEAFLAAGTGDIIAVYEAKARLDSAAADLVKAEGQVSLALQNLSSLTGIAIESVRDLAINQAQGPQPAEIDWWIETMRQRNPSLIQAWSDVVQAEESTKVARAGHYPVLDGNGGYTVDKGSTFLPAVATKQWYAGIRINVPIWSGGETNARTRRALAGESERRAVRDDIQENATKKLKEAFVNLQYNLSMVTAYTRKHESAALQLKAVQKGRDIGTRTAIDLLNAEQTYALSRRDLSSALYDNVQRRLELKAAAGILVEDDLAELNAMLMADK